MKKQKGVLSLIGIVIVVVLALVAIGGIFAYQYFTTPKENNQQQNQTACTTEAKVCPNGSSVGRTGPNCEFAECPAVVDPTAGWKTYANTQYGFEIKYPAGYSPYEFNNIIHFSKNNDEINWGVTITTATLQLDETCDSEKYVIAKKESMAGDSFTLKQVFLSGISENVSQLKFVYGTLPPTISTYIPVKDCLTSKRMIIISGSENLSVQYNQSLSTFKFTK